MNLSIFTLLISSGIALLIAATDYLHRGSLTVSGIILVIVAVVCYIFLLYIFERFIYKRIRNVYKLSRNLKLDKGLKDALGEQISDDPIRDTEREVQDWARLRVLELERLRAQAKFRQEFLANISLVLRTPLVATQGYVEPWQDGLIDDDREMAKNFLEKAARNLNRLSYLVQD